MWVQIAKDPGVVHMAEQHMLAHLMLHALMRVLGQLRLHAICPDLQGQTVQDSKPAPSSLSMLP